MKTFISCGLPWLPWPADGKRPCDPDQHVRVLTRDERDGKRLYDSGYINSADYVPWKLSNAGWYPVNPDGTEIVRALKPTRPRVIRRRFKLKTR